VKKPSFLLVLALLVFSIIVYSILISKRNAFQFRGIDWGSSSKEVIQHEGINEYSMDEFISIKMIEYNDIKVSNYSARLWYTFFNDRLVGAHYVISINNFYNLSIEGKYDSGKKTFNELKDNLEKIYGNCTEFHNYGDYLKNELPNYIVEGDYVKNNFSFAKWQLNKIKIYLLMDFDLFGIGPIQIIYGEDAFYDYFWEILENEKDKIEDKKKLEGL
jgi:hypothetical protein